MGFGSPNTSSFSAPALGLGLRVLCSPSAPGECWGQLRRFPLVWKGQERSRLEPGARRLLLPCREGSALGAGRARDGVKGHFGAAWETSCLMLTQSLSWALPWLRPGLGFPTRRKEGMPVRAASLLLGRCW